MRRSRMRRYLVIHDDTPIAIVYAPSSKDATWVTHTPGGGLRLASEILIIRKDLKRVPGRGLRAVPLTAAKPKMLHELIYACTTTGDPEP
jgi:hypothetical protein